MLVDPDLLKKKGLTPPDSKKVFVVYGRNERFRREMFTFLRAVGLDPMEWGQVLRSTQESTPYIGDALDQAFSKVQAAVVLLYGDDLARLGRTFLKPHDGPEERLLTPQARPNVLFEAGMAFGRSPRDVVIVALGTTRSFSDIVGRHLCRIDNTVAARQDLIERLEQAGCAVETKGKTDWHTAGDFDAASVSPDGASSITASLKVVRRRVDPQIGATYRPKVSAEVRNDSNECLEIRILGWNKTPRGVKLKYAPTSMQLKIGNVWCPEKEGVETLHVGPGCRIQAWVQPEVSADDQHGMEDLENR